MSSNNLSLTPISAPVAGINGDAIMQKLRAKAENAIRDAFLDTLSPDEYNTFIKQAIDEFINGPVSKRFELKISEEQIYSEEEYNRIAETCQINKPWTEGAKNYGYNRFMVTRSVPNVTYDANEDPTTFRGMLRVIVREQVKKDLIQDIINSPDMKSQFIAGMPNPNGSMGYTLFEGFAKKFLLENWAAIQQKESEALISNVLGRMLNDLRNNPGRGY